MTKGKSGPALRGTKGGFFPGTIFSQPAVSDNR